MAKQQSDLLGTLVRATQLSETEITARAIQVGLKQMWREWILSLYLKGEMTREQTVEEVGVDWVELAERQSKAAKEGVEWALSS